MTDDRAELLAALRSLFTVRQDRAVRAVDAYKALKNTGKLGSHRLVAYRCDSDRRCLLLDFIQLPDGVVVHNPPYKLSDGVNQATSTEAGRRANTSDGGNHWKAQTRFAEQGVTGELNCDHVLGVRLIYDEILADLAEGARTVLVSPTGLRRAVK